MKLIIAIAILLQLASCGTQQEVKVREDEVTVVQAIKFKDLCEAVLDRLDMDFVDIEITRENLYCIAQSEEQEYTINERDLKAMVFALNRVN